MTYFSLAVLVVNTLLLGIVFLAASGKNAPIFGYLVGLIVGALLASGAITLDHETGRATHTTTDYHPMRKFT